MDPSRACEAIHSRGDACCIGILVEFCFAGDRLKKLQLLMLWFILVLRRRLMLCAFQNDQQAGLSHIGTFSKTSSRDRSAPNAHTRANAPHPAECNRRPRSLNLVRVAVNDEPSVASKTRHRCSANQVPFDACPLTTSGAITVCLVL